MTAIERAREELAIFDHWLSHPVLNGRDPAVRQLVIDRRKKKIGKRGRQPNLPEILELEEQLRDELASAWTAQGVDAANEILSALATGSTELTVTEIEQALAVLAGKMGPAFITEATPILKTVLPDVYNIGREAFVQEPVFDLVDTRARDWLVQDNAYWIGEHYGSEVGPRIAEVVQKEVIEAGLGRGEAARALEEIFGDQFGPKSSSYWEVVATTGCTRSRNFGAVGSFVEAGFEEIEAVAVMDERTSPICVYLNGKVWKTEWAVQQRDAMLAAKTPTAARAASPWLPEDDIVGKTTEELQALGVVLGPYHARCRTINVVH